MENVNGIATINTGLHCVSPSHATSRIVIAQAMLTPNLGHQPRWPLQRAQQHW